VLSRFVATLNFCISVMPSAHIPPHNLMTISAQFYTIECQMMNWEKIWKEAFGPIF
jgi:hypothetical protein